MAIEIDGVRAETAGGAQRHGGVDAEFPGFVAGGGDYAALIGLAADDDGLAAELGALEQLDGDEEGVHVDVEDGGGGRGRLVIDGRVDGAEASQVGHAAQPTPFAFNSPAASGVYLAMGPDASRSMNRRGGIMLMS